MQKTNRPLADPADSIVLGRRGIFSGWTNFWLAPADPVGLHWLRFLFGVLCIYWLLPLAGHVDGFFGLEGWFDREAYLETSRLRAAGPESDPGITFSWSLLFLCGRDSTLLQLAYWGSIAIFALFALGIATRITGVLTWALVGSFLLNPASTFDADYLLVIPALYLMVGYLLYGQWSRNLAPVERFVGPLDASVFSAFKEKREETPPSHAANLAVRLLQVHFVFVVLTSAFHKLQFGAWWGGVAFWYPLTPPFETTQALIESRAAHRESYLVEISLAEYIVLAWQFSFPFFAWRTGMWRVVLFGGAVVGWIGSAAIFGLPLFGPVYLLCCLSFLTSEEWQGIARMADELKGSLTRRNPERAATSKQPVRVSS